MLLILAASAALLCAAGCGGGKSCEKPSCGSEEAPDGTGTARGCSIPGYGGCLSSGKGCNSACWPQSYKLVTLSIKKEDEDEEEEEKTVINMKACDTRYYGDGCLGCGQQEKSSYSGCIKMEGSSNSINGLFYGSSDSGEKIISCSGCMDLDGLGAELIQGAESLTGIE